MKVNFYNCRRKFVLILIVLLVSLCTNLHAASTDGWWYTDMLRGFAMYIPNQASYVRNPSEVELLRLTLAGSGGRQSSVISVMRVHEQSGMFENLESFTEALIEKLASESFRADPNQGAQQITVSDHMAIMLSGQIGSKENPLSRCEIWIQLEKNNFLVIRSSCDIQDASSIFSTTQSLAQSTRFFNPEQSRRQLLSQLESGAELVKEFDSAKIASCADGKTRWYAISNAGQLNGFLQITQQATSYENKPAIQTTTFSLTRGKKSSYTAQLEQCTYCPQTQVEDWSVSYVTKHANSKISTTKLSAIRQHNMLLLQYFGGNQDGYSHTAKLPRGGYYLPRALCWSPVKLMDLSQPKKVSFAQYNSATESFDMRSIEILHSTSTKLGTTSFNAVEINDTSTIGAPAEKVFVDNKGEVLKIVSHDGSVIQQTTESAIRSVFSAELNEIKIKNIK